MTIELFIRKAALVKSPPYWDFENSNVCLLLYKEKGSNIIYRIYSGNYQSVKEEFLYYKILNTGPRWLIDLSDEEKQLYYTVTLKEKDAIVNC